MKYAIELNRDQSERLLDLAAQNHSIVRIHPKSWPSSRRIEAKLDRHDPHGQLELTAEGVTDSLDSLLNMYCQIDLDFGDGQYFFDSHLMHVHHHGKKVHLAVAWPETIVVQQRRKHQRTALAGASQVLVSRSVGDDLFSFSGTLYNLSEEGLAFKLTTSDAEKIEVGQNWCACFEVPEQTHFYKLGAVIRRKMASSSEGFVIVGVEFDPMDQPEIQTLRTFLNARRESRALIGGQP